MPVSANAGLGKGPMVGTIFTLLALAFVGLLVVNHFKHKSEVDGKSARDAAPAKPAAKPYAAVKVMPAPGACKAAKRLSEQVYLAAEAPPLPLPGCTLECNCRYQYLDDRRQADRRAPGGGVRNHIEEAAGLNVTRKGRGRRSTDR